MHRPLQTLCALAILFLLPPAARTQAAVPPPYWPATDLRAEVAAVGPNPFAWAPPTAGMAAAPPRPTGAVPSNVAHLSLRRPYVLEMPGAAVERLTVTPRNPFDPGAPPATVPPAVAEERAADTYQIWQVSVGSSAWDALSAAWDRDPVTVRRLFREQTKQDWPVTTATGPRAEANRLAAARWVRRTWDAAVRQSVLDLKRSLGLRGPVIVAGPVDAALSFLAAGDAANGHALALAPRLTGDPAVNRYGVGFLLRLAADLGDRIPFPSLDLSALPPDAAPWAERWLDDAVRNGIQGLTVVPPAEGMARTRVQAALEPLGLPNVYLPPPSEVGILFSRDTATLEPGAWVALFRAYAALRAAGAWPNFVSDEQVAGGKVSLARYRMLVIPAAKWADRGLMDGIAAWTERGGTAVVSDPYAFSRAGDGWDTSARAHGFFGWAGVAFAEDGSAILTPAAGTQTVAAGVLERPCGHGRVVSLSRPLAPDTGPTAAFWTNLLRRAEVPSRSWLENVTIANVERVSGTYSRPQALK